jgi:CubicO group peptidase (beta-lactamase class C family)
MRAAMGCVLAVGVFAFLFGARGAGQTKTEAAVDEVFSDLTVAGSPGCALGVYREGRVIYSKGYGLANVEEGVAISPKSVFDIGSTSKQFTAASILLLEKQGKLSVNDDVRKYIPELTDYSLAKPGQKVTLLQMLNHTSGLRDYLVLFDLAGVNIDSVTTDEDALALIARQKSLNFAPGSEYLYSNSGFFLLSLVVKRVSGETLRDFAAANIFSPLGMAHTQYRDSHTALIADRAPAYDQNKKKDGFTLNVSYFEQTGDGAVHTSVEDLLKWDENFYSGQVGGKEFLAELQEKGKLNDGRKMTYAKGLSVKDYRGLHAVRHGGSWGGYRAELLRFPEQHFSVACLCNVGNAEPSRRAELVADVYLGNLMKAKEAAKDEDDEEEKKGENATALSAEQLQAYAGDYWSEELGVRYRLGVRDAQLEVLAVMDQAGLPKANGFARHEVRSAGKDKFSFGSGEVTMSFQRDSAGNVAGFVVDAGRTTGIRFVREGGK